MAINTRSGREVEYVARDTFDGVVLVRLPSKGGREIADELTPEEARRLAMDLLHAARLAEMADCVVTEDGCISEALEDAASEGEELDVVTNRALRERWQRIRGGGGDVLSECGLVGMVRA